MAPKKKDVKLVAGLWLLIGPTALFVVTVILYAIVNFAFGSGDNVARTISNVVLFVSGASSIVAWLPGVIIGIVLLASRK